MAWFYVQFMAVIAKGVRHHQKTNPSDITDVEENDQAGIYLIENNSKNESLISYKLLLPSSSFQMRVFA
ncbi:hypothetical protein KGR20_22195 [Cytobacillus oceanisediminis]|uniref:hypothetical protein n=1 Tax=Cytobacillus oceanisediminis TaxID=665099 RepID=UPI000C75E266|nr:hypothetical protein [Cytobacillus oceanisediminis]MBZ9536874.1 hypothetical protein [Cytobacillus oceanisediminis]